MKRTILCVLLSALCFTAACAVDDSVYIEAESFPPEQPGLGLDGVSKQQCLSARGHWNECGSPCAGTGADFCIEMCRIQCECGGIAGFGCPDGYQCRLSGKIEDEMGVCVEKQNLSQP